MGHPGDTATPPILTCLSSSNTCKPYPVPAIPRPRQCKPLTGPSSNDPPPQNPAPRLSDHVSQTKYPGNFSGCLIPPKTTRHIPGAPLPLCVGFYSFFLYFSPSPTLPCGSVSPLAFSCHSGISPLSAWQPTITHLFYYLVSYPELVSHALTFLAVTNSSSTYPPPQQPPHPQLSEVSICSKPCHCSETGQAYLWL